MNVGVFISDSFRKRPFVSVAQVLAFLVALPAFFSTVSFTDALTPDQAIAKYEMPLPPGWTAGVMNHGRYYRWWTIQDRPVLFAASIFFFASPMLFIWGSAFWIWRRNRRRDHAV